MTTQFYCETKRLVVKHFMLCQCLVAALLSACSNDVPMVSLGLEDSYRVCRMQPLQLKTEFTADAYRWTATNPNGVETVLSTLQNCTFVAADEGVYNVALELIDSQSATKYAFTVTVIHEDVEYSQFISDVYEYRPAPGQFINVMPQWESGDTEADMCRKVADALCNGGSELVSLGAYGGYVTFGFDHMVVNVDGEKDLMIQGNAFYESGYEDLKVGSCEPGIVMVSIDENGNGLPDDAWYELAGSEYNSLGTLHNYSITYSRPDADKADVAKPPYIVDAEYIPWRDSTGATGYIEKNFQHSQSYFPNWVDDDTMTFCGTRLANNAIDTYGNGSYFQLISYDWGYVDNHPNSETNLNSFDIGWAVDAYGVPVHLPGINFVRVYTGLNQTCNWLGETSTEVANAVDLHVAM